MTKDPSNAPHCFSALPRRLVPRSNNGVANVSDTDWRNELAVDPPGGNRVFHCQHDVDDDDAIDDGNSIVGIQPMLDSTKVSAIAVTGAPSSLPTMVVFPNSCASDAVNDKTAIFPQ